jgi:hypothetical protein
VNVYKTYLLNDDADIDIMATDDLVVSGGSIHFGTNEKTSISQLVAGQLRQYVFTDGRSYLVSQSGGATPLSEVRKLRYLVEFTPDPRDPRQHEFKTIEADVADVYSFVTKEEKMKSYTVAPEVAIGKRQKDFAVSALLFFFGKQFH